MEEKTLEERLLESWIINDIIRDKDGNIEQIYLSDDNYNIVACLTYPHEGNGNKFMLRADFIQDFDRWANAACEVFFEKEYEAVIDPDEVFELLSVNDEEED